MAKKKHQGKKHRFKYSEATSVAQIDTELHQRDGVVVVAAARGPKSSSAAMASTRDFSYVGVDVRRIMIMALALVGLELVLWLLLGHTGLGSFVYR